MGERGIDQGSDVTLCKRWQACVKITYEGCMAAENAHDFFPFNSYASGVSDPELRAMFVGDDGHVMTTSLVLYEASRFVLRTGCLVDLFHRTGLDPAGVLSYWRQLATLRFVEHARSCDTAECAVVSVLHRWRCEEGGCSTYNRLRYIAGVR